MKRTIRTQALNKFQTVARNATHTTRKRRQAMIRLQTVAINVTQAAQTLKRVLNGGR